MRRNFYTKHLNAQGLEHTVKYHFININVKPVGQSDDFTETSDFQGIRKDLTFNHLSMMTNSLTSKKASR